MCIKLFGADQCFGSKVHDLMHRRYKSLSEMALGLLYMVSSEEYKDKWVVWHQYYSETNIPLEAGYCKKGGMPFFCCLKRVCFLFHPN